MLEPLGEEEARIATSVAITISSDFGPLYGLRVGVACFILLDISVCQIVLFFRDAAPEMRGEIFDGRDRRAVE